MKCAKEVMEQWKVSIDERCKKDLCEMVERVTEELFIKASNNDSKRIPGIWVYTRDTIEGRPDVVEIKMDGDKSFCYVVIWNDFVSVLSSLCFCVSEGCRWHKITPNPSC